MPLTGRFWFRKTWTGRLVLLVEDKRPRWFGPRGAFKLRWRDARLLDLAEPPLRTLMSLERAYRTEYAPAAPPAPGRDVPAKGAAKGAAKGTAMGAAKGTVEEPANGPARGLHALPQAGPAPGQDAA